MISFSKILSISAVVILGSSLSFAAPVSVNSGFAGGFFGSFSVDFTGAPAGLTLQSLKFDLQSPLFADPTFFPPGALLPQALNATSGAASTGFLGATGASDGSASFTLLFSDFGAGESFRFDLDVDSPCARLACQIPAAITTVRSLRERRSRESLVERGMIR